MDKKLWHKNTIESLKHHLESDDRFVSLGIYGSLANKEKKIDYWSDVDAIIIVKDNYFEKITDSLEWLSFIGDIFAYNLSMREFCQTLRVVFNDFRRIDLVIVKESATDQLINPPEVPFWTDIDLVFNKNPDIKSILVNKPKLNHPTEIDPEEVNKLINDFWFLATLVITKVIREDLLVAMHLGLDLYKDCLLLGIWIADKDPNKKEKGSEILQELNIELNRPSKKTLLNLVDSCCQEFDRLSQLLDPSYQKKYQMLEQVIEQAYKDIQ